MNLLGTKRVKIQGYDLISNTLGKLCLGFSVLMLSACNITLQSSQYSFVKGLFAEEIPAIEKNWQVRWDGRSYLVYAINHEKGTFFADEKGFLLSFDGWQVVDLSLPELRGKKVATVEPCISADGSVILQYFKGEREELAKDLCRAWEREFYGAGTLSWRQVCVGLTGSYTNEILLNELGQLVSLRFVLLPSAQPIEIELR